MRTDVADLELHLTGIESIEERLAVALGGLCVPRTCADVQDEVDEIGVVAARSAGRAHARGWQPRHPWQYSHTPRCVKLIHEKWCFAASASSVDRAPGMLPNFAPRQKTSRARWPRAASGWCSAAAASD